MSEPGEAAPAMTGRAISQLRHELRTPVNAVLGYGEMLSEDAPAMAALLQPAIAAARDVLAAIEHALPPSATSIAAETLAALDDRLRPMQQRIIDAADEVLATGDGAVAVDAGRIRAAAERLTAILAAPPRAPGRDLSPGHASTGPADDEADVQTVIRTSPTPGPPPVPSEFPPLAGGAARILVVDDVADNREVLERRLTRAGHAVECAVNGRLALDRIREQRFDLILLDIMMPEVDGFEVLRRLKADPDTRDIPVIMISALDDLASVVRCIEQGAEDHLTKPFEPVLLRARITASLEKKRLRDREKEYIAEVKNIADAAMAVEEGRYQSGALSGTAVRADELGRLARVFDTMASEVKAREQRLRRQVTELRDAINAATFGGEDGGDARANLAIGSVLAGRFEIMAVVGFGAMGTVYKAFDRDLAEVVAVKTLRPELLTEPVVLERFKAEVRLARRISHPAVVRTHDFGEWDGAHYLTMEFVEGLTARELLDSRGRLGVASVLAIGTQLAQALAAAHAQGVIHRDIKPQNLLLDSNGSLKVMDFGVSRLADGSGNIAEAGMLIGTPAYMAPEQLLAQPVDERIDLYATGVVLYECLTGRLPFYAPSPVAMVGRVLSEEAPPAVAHGEPTPPALTALIARLLAKPRELRPASASEVVTLLGQIN